MSRREMESCILSFSRSTFLHTSSTSAPLAAASRLSYFSLALTKTNRTERSFSVSMSSEPPNPKPKRVVVCGGGVIGASTAYFLSTLQSPTPVHVILVEKSSVACAASGKAGGFLALDWCDGGPLSSLARASFDLHRSLAEELDGALTYGYRPVHTLSLSVDKGTSGGSSTSRSQGALLPPWVDGPVRNARTIGTVETTAQVHPQLFTRRLVSAAVEKGGVDLLIGEVENVELDGNRAVGVSVRKEDGERSSIGADAVVLALGPWSSRNTVLSSLFRVSGLKAHSIVLRPEDPDAITPHALSVSYIASKGSKTLDPEIYPRPTGEVYICGMSKEVEVPEDPEKIVGDPESIAMLHEIAGTVSTHLATRGGNKEAQIVSEQACFLPCTDDGIPVIGEIPGATGCFVGTGHSCWGILNGPATGKALAELILHGSTTTVDLKPFVPARFQGKQHK